MNIARFTLSLALLASVVTPAVAHKDGCSHDCKHESLHPTKTTKKSTSSHIEEETDKTKKVEIAESKIEVAQTIAEPVTVTTVSTPVEATFTTAVIPAETATTIEVVKAPEIVQVAAVEEVKEEAPKAVEIKEETIKVASTDKAAQNLSEEEKEKRRQFGDLRPEDLQALIDADDLTLSSVDDTGNLEADVKTAAAPAPEAQEAQDDINNLTQVMI